MESLRRRVTRDCLRLDVRELVRNMPEGWRDCGWPTLWQGSAWGLEIHTSAHVDLDARALRLKWWAKDGRSHQRLAEGLEVFRMETTSPNYGGERWWLLCPGCGERRAIAYLRPLWEHRPTLWRCRVCHDLTYASAQEHDTRVDQLRRVYRQNPGRVWAMAGDTSDLRRAVRALKVLYAEELGGLQEQP